jgi:hypothetical protein
MPRSFLSLVALTGLAAGAGAADRPARLPQHVLYLGNAKTQRAREFADFFRRHFARVQVDEREGFDPRRAARADVVVLDWSQRDPRTKPPTSPLGSREAWGKPTVLLGSAGHLLAGAWEVRGGSG